MRLRLISDTMRHLVLLVPCLKWKVVMVRIYFYYSSFGIIFCSDFIQCYLVDNIIFFFGRQIDCHLQETLQLFNILHSSKSKKKKEQKTLSKINNTSVNSRVTSDQDKQKETTALLELRQCNLSKRAHGRSDW